LWAVIYQIGKNTIEFKIQLEESVVQTLGSQEVEKQLEDFAQKLILRMAAQDILEELTTIDLENDKECQMARNLAWEQEKHKYLDVHMPPPTFDALKFKTEGFKFDRDETNTR